MQLTRRQWITGSAMIVGTALGGCDTLGAARGFEYTLTDAQWRAKLSNAAYLTLRHESTERPYSSPLNAEKRKGIFQCAGCDRPVFSSSTKFDSRTGWPSFWRPLNGAIGTKTDWKIGSPRTEVHCIRCGGHLGHVFDDGPPPTGKRYCINGVALKFVTT